MGGLTTSRPREFSRRLTAASLLKFAWMQWDGTQHAVTYSFNGTQMKRHSASKHHGHRYGGGPKRCYGHLLHQLPRHRQRQAPTCPTTNDAITITGGQLVSSGTTTVARRWQSDRHHDRHRDQQTQAPMPGRRLTLGRRSVSERSPRIAKATGRLTTPPSSRALPEDGDGDAVLSGQRPGYSPCQLWAAIIRPTARPARALVFGGSVRFEG